MHYFIRLDPDREGGREVELDVGADGIRLLSGADAAGPGTERSQENAMKTLRQLLAPTLAAGLCCAAGAEAAPMVFTMDALTDTRVSPLNTGIALLAGDAFEVSADPDDLWNAGALPR